MPATIAEAELPMPWVRGISLPMEILSAGISTPYFRAVPMAVSITRLVSSSGSTFRKPSRKLISHRSLSDASIYRNFSSARPTESNPGPRFALVAGTLNWCVAIFSDAFYIVYNLILIVLQHFRFLCNTVYGGLMILHTVSSQYCDYGRTFFNHDVFQSPEHLYNTCLRPRFCKPTLCRCKIFIRIKYLIISNSFNPPAVFIAGGCCEIPAGRVSDTDGSRHRLRLLNHFVIDDGCRTRRFKTIYFWKL